MKRKTLSGRFVGQSNRFVLFVRHSHPVAIPAESISLLLEKPAILLPQTDPVRTEGMPGNDEKTRIEAFATPGCSKVPRATKRGRKNRGVPPPATFDVDTLPGSSNLTVLEAAAVIRRTPGALEQWRREPSAEMALRRRPPALSCRCGARLSGQMR